MKSALENKKIFFEQNPGDYSTQWVVDLINLSPISELTRMGSFGNPSASTSKTWKGKDYWKYDDVKADENIVVCPKCNNCWEKVTAPGERDYIIYPGFPKLGKKVGDICPKCEL